MRCLRSSWWSGVCSDEKGLHLGGAGARDLTAPVPSCAGRRSGRGRGAHPSGGSLQTQVARSAFVAVSARMPGATHDDITTAYERLLVVRGSNLRGTVHTCAGDQHRVVDVVTRRAMSKVWHRSLKLTRVGVDEVRDEIERYATGAWRTPDELRAHLSQWLARRESAESFAASRTSGLGRSMAHVHSALIRRPLRGGWDQQSAPGYRRATEVLGERRAHSPDDPDAALAALARIHLASYGPASRRDIAWWSGEGLRNVDTALTSLGAEVTERPGPGGVPYYDLVERRRAVTRIRASGCCLSSTRWCSATTPGGANASSTRATWLIFGRLAMGCSRRLSWPTVGCWPRGG